MRTRIPVAFCVLALCGAASAQTQLPTIEVRAGTAESVMVSCANPDSVTKEDVGRVLSVEDVDMTRALHKRFTAAVSEACKAGVAHILVKRDERDHLTWKRTD